MSRDLGLLVNGFHTKVDSLIDECAKESAIMRAFFTLRSPWEQSRIWRSTRSTEEVKRAAKTLDGHRAPYLAKVLIDVGPQYAPPGSRGHLTNALPGQSWHQYGLAVDCYWFYDGEAQWSEKRQAFSNGGSFNGYKVYAQCAKTLGLTSMDSTVGIGHTFRNRVIVVQLNSSHGKRSISRCPVSLAYLRPLD